MELTNGLNKRVVEIYRGGGELVWEMPRVHLTISSLMSGQTRIQGKTYPLDSNINIFITNRSTNKKEEYKLKNNGIEWSIRVEELMFDDEVAITASADGWQEAGYDNSVH